MIKQLSECLGFNFPDGPLRYTPTRGDLAVAEQTSLMFGAAGLDPNGGFFGPFSFSHEFLLGLSLHFISDGLRRRSVSFAGRLPDVLSVSIVGGYPLLGPPWQMDGCLINELFDVNRLIGE